MSRDALRELRDVLARGECPLAWLLAHAPEGDADAALRRAWEGTTDPVAVLWFALPEDADAGYRVWGEFACRVGHPRRLTEAKVARLWRVLLPRLRAVIRCPTWAELMGRDWQGPF